MITENPLFTSDAAELLTHYRDLLKRHEALQLEHLKLLTDYNRLVSNTVVAYESIKLEPNT